MTTPDRFIAGAIDLGEVKARAEARQQAHVSGPGKTGLAHSIEITMENLENEVLRRSTQVPVVVLIGTSRSPDSEQLKADFTALAARSNLSFIFGYVDADTSSEVAQAFGVQGLPTTVAIAAGRPLADFQGGQPADAITQWVASIIQAVSGQLEGLPAEALAEVTDTPEPVDTADPRFDAATEALNNGDFAGAVTVYDEILAVEPKNAEAKQARDTALLLGRLSEVSANTDVHAEADADPANSAKAFLAADADIAAGNPEAAFSRLIAVLQRSAAQEKTVVRDRLVELFGLFEATDPRVISARGQMASALY